MANFNEAEQRIQKALQSGAVELDLSELGLTTVPNAITQLTNLHALDLNYNRLTSLPDAITQLTNLQTLNLSANELTALPNAITYLTNLQTLNLRRNQLTSLSEVIAYLSSLQVLNLSFNQLMTVPEVIAQLTNLQVLDLSNNQLMSLPDVIAQFTHLQTLFLSGNRLMSLPDAITQLTHLQRLDLSYNRLTTLPEGMQQLTQLEGLYLHGNNNLNLPSEILWLAPYEGKSDHTVVQAILEYYYRTREGQKRSINEAKLILVGFGAVGKTSLINRLVHNTFDKDASQTHGIQITHWPIQINRTEDVRLNIWDFGGQEIMHATHQFFLTQRSLYILVLNGRQGHEDADAEYWLNLIESFGEDSSVIVVLNKIKTCPFDLNRRGLQQKFINIAAFIETDCEDGYNLDQLCQTIERETNNLKHLRDAFPASWFGIKDKLTTMPENYISYRQYCDLCTDQGETEPQAQETLAFALHSLGIVLNYKNDPRLQDTHILNPHWVTQGIYTILTSKTLSQQKGELNLCDIAKLLNPEDYPKDRHPFLIDLMRKFELCVPFPDHDGHYLIPQLLDKQQSQKAETFAPTQCLNFQYHYPILPEGLLPRFIVRTYTHSTHQPRWRTGVILEFEGAKALVKADIQAKRVYISVAGNSASQRSLLAIIRANFANIHGSFSFQPEAMVPIPGHPEVLIPYQDLLVREEKGRKTVEVVLPSKDIIDLRVADLLDGVGRTKTDEASPIDPHFTYNDYRGATIGNVAEHQNGTQQTTQIPAPPTQLNVSQSPETP
jgi:internalin A